MGLGPGLPLGALSWCDRSTAAGVHRTELWLARTVSVGFSQEAQWEAPRSRAWRTVSERYLSPGCSLPGPAPQLEMEGHGERSPGTGQQAWKVMWAGPRPGLR